MCHVQPHANVLGSLQYYNRFPKTKTHACVCRQQRNRGACERRLAELFRRRDDGETTYIYRMMDGTPPTTRKKKQKEPALHASFVCRAEPTAQTAITGGPEHDQNVGESTLQIISGRTVNLAWADGCQKETITTKSGTLSGETWYVHTYREIARALTAGTLSRTIPRPFSSRP